MASRSDVRAGRAYVELGTDSTKLIAGLRAGLRIVRSFAEEASAIGRRTVLVGAATVAGLVAIAHGFSEAGEAQAKFRNQTGLSADVIAGLTRAAADNEVPFDTMRASITALQKRISGGGKEVEEALAKIGTTLDEVRRMSPDQILKLIADGLPEIEDEADRVGIAMALMGRSGAEMLAIFKKTAADLRGSSPFGTLSESLSSLQEAIAKGGPEVEKALGRLGLSVEELRGMRADKALARVQKQLSEIPDEAERAAMAIVLFGENASKGLSGVRFSAPKIDRGDLRASYDSARDELERNLSGKEVVVPFTADVQLSAEDEEKFRDWYARQAKAMDLDRNPDAAAHKYYYRRAFKAGVEPNEDKHFPSEFKAPDHPNRFVDGEDTITGKQATNAQLALKKLGLGLEELKQHSPDEALSRILERLPMIRSEAERTATAFVLLGKDGLKLVPPKPTRAPEVGDTQALASLRSAVTTTQEAISKGGVGVEAALGKMGISIDGIRRMRPDDALALILENLPLIRSETQRTAASVVLMGRRSTTALADFVHGASFLRGFAPFKTLTVAFDSLEGKLGSGSPAVVHALEQMGLAVEDIDGRRIDEIFSLITSRLPQVKSEAERATIALAIFGKKGAAALSMLNADVSVSADASQIEALGASMSTLQKRLASGGSSVADDLRSIGLELSELQSLRPDEALARVTEKLPSVTSEAARAGLTLRLLGRSGVGMLAGLTAGSMGIRSAGDEAKRMGTAFSADAADAAQKLDDEFDKLTGSATGLRNSIGQGLTPALVPLLSTLSQVIQVVSAWIRLHPEAVQAFLGMTIAVTGLAAAVTVLAAAVYIATAPIGLIVLAVLAVVVAFLEWVAVALAVTDVLGITSTGFGDLFNSIRIGGQGLATWLGKLWSYMVEGWEYVKFGIETAFDTAWTFVRTTALTLWGIIKDVAKGIYTAFSSITSPIVEAFQPVFDFLMDGFEMVYDFTVGIFKKLVGWISDLFSWAWGETKEFLDTAEKANGEQGPTFSQRLDERKKKAQDEIERQRKVREELDANDPNDGVTFGFDKERAKKAALKVATSPLEGLRAALGELVPGGVKPDKPKPTEAPAEETPSGVDRPATPNPVEQPQLVSIYDLRAQESLMNERETLASLKSEREALETKAKTAQGDELEDIKERISAIKVEEKGLAPLHPEIQSLVDEIGAADPEIGVTKTKSEATTTFDAELVGRLGIGSSIEERGIQAQERTAQNTKEILDSIRNGSLTPSYGA